MNKLIISGRLTKDATTGTTASGRGWIAMNIAVDRDYKNADGSVTTDFISVMLSRQSLDAANNFATYLKKGKAVEVIGSLHSKTVTLADGTKNTVLSVSADSVNFALTNNTGATQTTAPAAATAPTTPTVESPVVDENDLPF